MRITRHENGDLTVPMRAESEDGMVIGDGMARLKKGTPEWKLWDDWLTGTSLSTSPKTTEDASPKP